MHERLHTKQEESAYLAHEYQKNPHLFERKTFVDDAPMLGEFGIQIPGKEDFVAGALKLWPEDFIVEEISKEGEVASVMSPKDRILKGGTPTKVLTATLVKCNISTLEAICDIARLLTIPTDDIGYAGMKDKDAITAQRISLRGVSIEKAQAIESPFFFLTDFEYGKGVIQRGALRGNRFTILVRTPVPLSDPAFGSTVARALERVATEGFYNFFYLQRFSMPRLRNYQWAYDILRGDYKQAVLDILTVSAEREMPFFKNIRADIKKTWGKWQEVQDILAPFPMFFVHEQKIVAHLVAHPTDFAGALQTIPEQITIWLNALGSLFFNKKIAEYVLRGQKPPSDLPFFLSVQAKDQDVYKDMLVRYGLWPIPFANLAPFPFIKTKGGHATPTKSFAKILQGKIVDQGLLLQFELGKGQYATTFLSHVFNLLSGPLPPGSVLDRTDTRLELGQESLAGLLAHFESVIQQPDENDFAKLVAKGD